MPICSIVIRCYNEAKHIGRLLDGILQQTIKDIEIIVVDSGSTDETVSIAKQYPVKILTINKNEFSFGRSLNMGCSEATGEYIVIASAHVYPVYRDWLQQLLHPFNSSTIGLVYGKQRGNATTQYAEHRVFESWFPDETDSLQTHPFCNNANAAIRRSLWEQQRYDESLTGLEDIDWARKMMNKGYYLAYVAEAEVIHVHNERPAQTYNRYRREAIALKRIYPETHFNMLDFLRLVTFNVFSDYIHAVRDGVFLQEFTTIPRFRLMQFWGTYRGHAQQLPVTQKLKRNFYYPTMKRSKVSGRTEHEDLQVDYSNQ